ncbi:hypothetical protein ACIRPK_35930 [Kitasatospora sp. NPDC101801]|uniref:hypothetical protein n=1 Tax=Kitasatospora sp. NPDC101801 TaxID=3364103 RepID=UPI0037F2E104
MSGISVTGTALQPEIDKLRQRLRSLGEGQPTWVLPTKFVTDATVDIPDGLPLRLGLTQVAWPYRWRARRSAIQDHPVVAPDVPGPCPLPLTTGLFTSVFDFRSAAEDGQPFLLTTPIRLSGGSLISVLFDS